MSQEISAKIAEGIFGWKWSPPPTLIHPAKNKNWQPYPDHADEVLRDMREDLPNFPEDIAMMMDACESLAMRGWRCVANMGTDGTWEAFFTKGDADLTVPCQDDHFGQGTTLAFALAMATIVLLEHKESVKA